MVIGLPRSGTTWAANWLTTTESHCLHDPLYRMHYRSWDQDSKHFPQGSRFRGISCTGIWRWPDWVNDHPARKIVIHRDIEEVQESLSSLGLPLLDDDALAGLMKIDAPRIRVNDLFKSFHAARVWKHLIGTEFCERRHSELCAMHIDAKLPVVADEQLQDALWDELDGA